MASWEIIIVLTAVVSVWLLVDWWRVERHQPFPDEENNK
jgi:hypothetical protein